MSFSWSLIALPKKQLAGLQQHVLPSMEWMDALSADMKAGIPMLLVQVMNMVHTPKNSPELLYISFSLRNRYTFSTSKPR
ncbi:hypothetical protein, partial [Brachymonas sp. M4Q-1]|uniref:hypothetical protein n=1 Tax=Brachymonas sp. M4Q-1 TaxID=3416906 RepID=UPI003CF9AD87